MKTHYKQSRDSPNSCERGNEWRHAEDPNLARWKVANLSEKLRQAAVVAARVA
jgi:hypothetical protein